MKNSKLLLLPASVLLTVSCASGAHREHDSGMEPVEPLSVSCPSPTGDPTYFPKLGRWKVSQSGNPAKIHLPPGAYLYFEDFHQTGKDVVMVPKPPNVRATHLSFCEDIQLPGNCKDAGQDASLYIGEADWHPRNDPEVHLVGVFVYDNGQQACIGGGHVNEDETLLFDHDGAAHTHEDP